MQVEVHTSDCPGKFLANYITEDSAWRWLSCCNYLAALQTLGIMCFDVDGMEPDICKDPQHLTILHGVASKMTGPSCGEKRHSPVGLCAFSFLLAASRSLLVDLGRWLTSKQWCQRPSKESFNACPRCMMYSEIHWNCCNLQAATERNLGMFINEGEARGLWSTDASPLI